MRAASLTVELELLTLPEDILPGIWPLLRGSEMVCKDIYIYSKPRVIPSSLPYRYLSLFLLLFLSCRNLVYSNCILLIYRGSFGYENPSSKKVPTRLRREYTSISIGRIFILLSSIYPSIHHWSIPDC